MEDHNLYYYLCRLGAAYVTVFVSVPMMIPPEVDFSIIPKDQRFINLETKIGEITLITKVDKPLYLFNIERDLTDVAGDDNVLDLFPNNTMPEIQFRTMRYPTFFKLTAEPYFDYKLGDRLYKKVNAVWTPVTTI